ncbi:hypothetical protein WS72_05110 [Burkholderia savannae]|uniref:Uncharacterized protein n=1 Tax=Burkholderia savannae TaxID=1637837 RepID=A0ABR5TBD9_9BURK|nr:hypothetical protein WS72_05110 [Burkholderia savannae]
MTNAEILHRRVERGSTSFRFLFELQYAGRRIDEVASDSDSDSDSEAFGVRRSALDHHESRHA